jgi:tetratricopeptide (TPR) repeat protein
MKKYDLDKPLLHILLIVLLSLIAYGNTLSAPFHFDGKYAIADNPIIKDLRYFIEPSEAKDFKGIFGYKSLKIRYITFLTFALNYNIHGLQVAGYHIVNILIHISASLLLYLLVILTFNTPFLRGSPLRDYSGQVALFTSLLFACHPIQTQAVTYIFQRATSLSAMFYLLSLVAYVKWRLNTSRDPESLHFHVTTKRSFLLYLCCITASVLGMKTKGISFMLPVTVALYESIFFRGEVKRRVIYLLPLLFTMLIFPLSVLTAGTHPSELIGDMREATRGASNLPRWIYLITEFRVITTYIRLVFFPVNQNLDYDYPIYRSFFDMEVFLSFVLLAILFGLGILLLIRFRNTAPHARLISFGIFWFFINLAIESSIIPLYNVIFEHRLYLPSVGIFLAVVTALYSVVKQLQRKWTYSFRVLVFSLFIIAIILSGLTYARNMVWQDEASLWKDVADKSPKRFFPQYNLGNAYMSKGLADKAVQHYLASIQLNPYFAPAYYNLGIAYRHKGFVNKAIEQYLTAIELAPDHFHARNNLANAYMSKGLVDKAVEQYMTVTQLDPDNAAAHVNLGNVYLLKGKFDSAIKEYETAISLKPGIYEAHNNLGIAYNSIGLTDKAKEHLEKASRLKENGKL